MFQLEKSLNSSIKFAVPPSQETGLSIAERVGEVTRSIALVKASSKVLVSCYSEKWSKSLSWGVLVEPPPPQGFWVNSRE